MQQERSEEECWQLVLELEPLIRGYAHKVTRWGLSEFDDVHQDGMIGAWEAARTWDPEIATFKTHAWYRISGAIKDGLRLRDIVHRRSNWDPDDPRIQQQSSLNQVLSSDDLRELGDMFPDPDPGPEEISVERAYTDWQLLQAEWAMQRLAPYERDVLRLYFWGGLTLWQVGERLGFTESRACQIVNKSLGRLEQFMVARDELLAG